ncbi:MAG TPA: hypothetical protein VGJ26_22050 [Pirellulales bacterium]
MSIESADSWNLLDGRAEDGLALLERAGVKGFVMPVEGNWVSLVAEEGWISGSPRVSQSNTGIALHLVVTAAFWWFEVYEGTRLLLIAGFHGGEETNERQQDVAGLCRVLRLSSERARRLESLLSLGAKQRSAKRIDLLSEFLELLGLPRYATQHFKRIKKAPLDFGAVPVVPQRPAAQPTITCNGDQPDCVLFPKGMYGTQSDVSRWASRIATKLYRGESLSTAIDRADRICGIHSTAAIYIENCRPILDPLDDEWRAYVLQDACFKKPRDDGTGHARNHYLLLTDAMSELWFALGMLGDTLGFGAAAYPKGVSRQRINCHFLEKFVRWLPEMQVLAPRLKKLLSDQPDGDRYWIGEIIGRTVQAGWKPNYDIVRSSSAEVIDKMIEDRVIERHDGRYRLTEEFRTAAR